MSYPIALSPPLTIAKGGIERHKFVQKFGTNEAVGVSYVPVTSSGVFETPMSTGAAAVRLKAGGNANDTAAGSGAREVTVYGLDDSWNEAEEAIATNGVLASLYTSTLWTRIDRERVTKSGTYATSAAGSHAAALITEDAAANIWSEIPFDGFPFGTTEVASRSIAAGDVAYIIRTRTFTDSAKTTELLLFVRELADEVAAPYSGVMRVLEHYHLKGGPETQDFSDAPIKVVGPADIGFMARVDVGTAAVSAGFLLMIESD